VTDYEAVQHKWYVEYDQDLSKMEELVVDYGSPKMYTTYTTHPWDYILQEYCGQFLDDTYALFPYSVLEKTFKEDISKIKKRLNDEEQEFIGDEDNYLDSWNERTERPDEHDNYLVMGVDFGKSGHNNDKTSIQIVEKNGDMLLHRYSRNLSRLKFPDLPSQAEEIARVAAGFRVNKIVADGGGMGIGVVPLIQRMVPDRKVESVEFSNTNKEEMIINLKSLMERGKIWLMGSEQELYHELHNMRAVQLPSGSLRYEGEPHDDMVWALALAAKEGTYKHFAIYTIDTLLKGLV
jgi:phage FluMu gp28-like protein